MYSGLKLKHWIDIEKLDWRSLSANPNAIPLLEQNLDKIEWNYLSGNPNAIHLLEKNIDKIRWEYLSFNPNAIRLLEAKQAINKLDRPSYLCREISNQALKPSCYNQTLLRV